MAKEIIIISLIIVILIAGITIGSVSFGKSQLRKSCVVFGQQSDRETKYVEYTWWRFDCLTLQENGKWISAFNLRDK